GTSGGTLAPIFTIGGGAGYAVAALLASAFPGAGIDPRIGALVGMAATFAGATRALLASAVFAFEATRQPIGLLPLLGGGPASLLVSMLLMRNAIMTEKIARRGTRVTTEYSADWLARLLVRDHATRQVVTIRAEAKLAVLTEGLPTPRHHGYPVVDAGG